MILFRMMHTKCSSEMVIVRTPALNRRLFPFL